MLSVVTANDLRSGAVIYLAPGGRWERELADAAIAQDAAGLKGLETIAADAVARNEVTAVYAMTVRVVEGRPEPVSVREKIRAAHAPTI
jgi:sulfite reductase (NADPH) hemoprotein beta-component